MRNPYQKMTDHIHPPEELNERVLAAARGKAAPEQHRSARRWGRAAVCAACALALVLGTWSMYPGTEGATGEDDAPVTTLPTFSFGLTAYAAGTGGGSDRGRGWDTDLPQSGRDVVVRKAAAATPAFCFRSTARVWRLCPSPWTGGSCTGGATRPV